MPRPWWVEGAEVHSALEFVSTVLVGLARFTAHVDNDNGFCLREQIYFDGCGVGINQDAGKRLRAASRRLR